MAQAWLNMTDGSVSPIIGAVFVYSASFVFGWISYNIVEKILPQTFHQLGFDCIKTLTICAYPFGHVLMWKFYGGTGFLGGMVPIMVFTILALPKGDGTPVAVWVNYFRGVLSLWTCLLKTIVMIFAAFAAYKLGIFLYQSKVHEHFTTKLKDNEAGVCPSALKVSLLQGFLIETLGLVYDAWFSTLKLSGNKVIDTLLKVTNTGIVVVAGFHYTGMFMHPAKASALTYGCGQTPVYAHLVVYWLGPLVGAWLITRLINVPKGSLTPSEADKKQK